MRLRVQIAAALAATLIVLMLAAALTAGAAPGARENPDPTPTLVPSENTPYTLTKVGGVDETLTFEYADQEGFTLGATTVTSTYPRGMVFTIAPESANGAISDATLYYRFVHDSGARGDAEWDAANEQWVAHIWATGEQRPAFVHIRFHWRVRDETGAYVDTEEYEVDYWDPNREWFRMESDDVLIYWFGFGEDDPDFVAQLVADKMAATSARLEAGFGRRLSYKPMAAIYPDLESFGEITASGIANNRIGGFTSSDLGVSVQILRDAGLVPGAEGCVWSAPADYWTMENRIRTIAAVTPHEVTHLYQFDVIGYAPGFEWVSEGQAEFFSNNFRSGWERLPHLASLQTIPSLTVNIGSDIAQADGCTALSYVIGPSFWNHLNIHYGGMETIARIIEMQHNAVSIYDAVEQITGKTFLEVENEWRVNYGFRPLTLADVDPASALEPYEDSLLAVGDAVTLPATPMMVKMYEDPGKGKLPGPQCFANTPVTILRMGVLDEIAYFEIDCMGLHGWVTRDVLVGP